MGDAERVIGLLQPEADRGNDIAARAIRMIRSAADPDRTALNFERGMQKLGGVIAEVARGVCVAAAPIVAAVTRANQAYVEKGIADAELHANDRPTDG